MSDEILLSEACEKLAILIKQGYFWNDAYAISSFHNHLVEDESPAMALALVKKELAHPDNREPER